MATLKKLIEDSEAAFDAEAPSDVKFERPGHKTAKVYSLRLAPEMVADLEALATKNGTTVSAIIRGFIDEGLADRSESDVKQVLSEVRQLRAAIEARPIQRVGSRQAAKNTSPAKKSPGAKKSPATRVRGSHG